jgi:hypothetical protein
MNDVHVAEWRTNMLARLTYGLQSVGLYRTNDSAKQGGTMFRPGSRRMILSKAAANTGEEVIDNAVVSLANENSRIA